MAGLLDWWTSTPYGEKNSTTSKEHPMPETKAPSKKWRVYGARGMSTDHRSQRAAYEAVNTITRLGSRATVYHWENGGWKLYERIDALSESS